MNKKDFEKWKHNSEFSGSLIDDSMIRTSMKNAKHDHKVFVQKCLSCVFIPFLTFALLVNTNQQFVSAMSNIPFISDLTQILKLNPSVYLARDTEIHQKIDKTYITDAYNLYLESMIVDEDQIVIFYDLNINIVSEDIIFERIRLINDEESVYFFPNTTENLRYAIVDPESPIDYETITIEFELEQNSEAIVEPVQIDISNDLSRVIKGKEVYINKQMNIDNQVVTVEKLTVYPLRTIIDVIENTNNTVNVLDYKFEIKVGKEVLSNISNGVVQAKISDEHHRICLESPYAIDDEFDIYLSSVDCIDKDKQNLVFNLYTQSFDYLPENIRLVSVDDEYILVEVDMPEDHIVSGIGKFCEVWTEADPNKQDSYMVKLRISDQDRLDDNHIVIKDTTGYFVEINEFVSSVKY